MSTVVDQRVAELRFDNEHFEKNVATSMSTLDKLKQKLNLTGASKGLEDVGRSAKNVDLSNVSNSAETVGLKFNAMYTMADQAFRNITNSAMAAGKKIVSALTIDPIKTGFKEYETQINAVQTILANTQSKGTTIDDVNKALDELNAYADKTIYNFTEMTRNIGTFTAAGVDLETSTNAIQGIANLAAVSGSTSQQASTAMYQLSQALSSGTVKLMDWNSVVNAGMGGQVFQDALKETARVHGIAIDDMITKQGSFRETLSEGWLTSEILTETLQKFTLTTEGLTEEQIAANREMLKAKGYTDEQIDAIFELGKTATNAATKVKTFTQLWDVLKEAAQSGWSRTWKLIIGDFEEAKALLTPLADFLTGIINKFSDWRNAIIESALAKNFKDVGTKVKAAFDSVENAISPVTDAINTVNNALVNYDELVNQIIRGEWGNAPTRWQDLAAAGYDWAHAQNLVNERLGSSVRHATNYKEAADGAAKSNANAAETTGSLTEEQGKLIEELLKLSDAELKAKGYSDEQIKSFRELQKIADKLGFSVSDLLKNIDNINGRWLLVNSFKNIGQSLITIFKSIGEAWNDAFGISQEDAANKLFDVIAGFHKLTQNLFNTITENSDELTRTLKGVFAILDLILMIVGGPIKIAFKLLTKVLGMFDMNILDLTAKIGDIIVKFRNWVEENDIIMRSLEKIVNIVKNFVLAIWNLPIVQKAFNAIKDAVTGAADAVSGGIGKILDFIEKLSEGVRDGTMSIGEAAKEIGKYLIDGLINGIDASRLPPVLKELGIKLLEALKDVLGIESPSKETEEVGNYVIEGLIVGLTNGFKAVTETIKGLAETIIKGLQGLDFNSILSMALGGGMLFTVNKIANIFGTYANAFGDITGTIESTAKSLAGSLRKYVKAMSANLKAEAFFTTAKAILVLVAALALLTLLDQDKLKAALAILASLAIGLVAFTQAMGKLQTMGVKFASAGMILSIASSILILAIALRVISKISHDGIAKCIVSLTVVISSLAALFYVFGKFVTNGDVAAQMGQAGIMMISMSVAMLFIAKAIKKLAKISVSDIVKGLSVVTYVMGLFGAIVVVSQYAGQHGSKAGTMLLLMSVAMLIMVKVIKKISKLNIMDITKGITVITTIGLLFGAFVLVSNYAGQHAAKAGAMLLLAAVAFSIMTKVIKQISRISDDDITRGLGVITAMEIMFGALMVLSKYSGQNAVKAGVMILMVSGALLLLTGVIMILSIIDPAGLTNAVTAIAILELCFGGLIALTKFANGEKGVMGVLITLIVAVTMLTIAIGVMTLLDQKKMMNAMVALSTLMGVFAALIKSTSSIGSDTKLGKALTIIIVLTAIVAALGVVIWKLSEIENPLNVLGSALALSMLVMALSGAIKIMSTITSGNTKGLWSAVLALLAICVPLAGLAFILASMSGVENAIVNAAALAGLATAAAGLVALLGAIGNIPFTSILAGLGGLTLICVPLAGLAFILASMSGVENAATNAMALAGLATVLSLLLIPLALVGVLYVATYGVALLGIVGLCAMLIPLQGLVAILKAMEGMQNAEVNAKLIMNLLTTMADVCLKIAVLAPLVILGVVGMYALTSLILVIGGIAALIGKFLPDIGDLISVGLPILIQLAGGIGEMIGAFVGGIATHVAKSLPTIGAALSGFMIGATAFISGARLVDDKVKKGAGILIATVALLTAVSFVESIASFLTFGKSFASLGTELSLFMINAMPFITMARLITPEMTESVKMLADTILILTAANIIEGLGRFIGGGSSLANFGSELVFLGAGLNGFIKALGPVTEEQLTNAKNAAKIIKTLADVSANLPNSGGWLGAIVGENDLGTWSESLPTVGKGIAGFINAFSDMSLSDDQVKIATNAAEIIKTLAEAGSTIENSGGWLASIVGDNKLDTWSAGLPMVGAGIAAFLACFKDDGLDQEDVDEAVNAAKIVTELAKASKQIDNEGGAWAAVFGDNNFAGWATALPDVATGVKNFIANLPKEIPPETVESTKVAMDIVKTLSDMTISFDSSYDGKEFEEFGNGMAKFASKIVEVIENASQIKSEKVKKFCDDVKNLVTLASHIALTDSSKLSEFGKGMKKIGQTGFNGYIEAWSGEDSAEKVSKAAQGLIDNMKNGIENGQVDLNTASKDCAMKAATAIETNEVKRQFKSAGKYLGDGLIEGINAKWQEVYDAAYELGQAAVQGEKDGQASNSPSKLTILAGKWLGEGLIIGMDKMNGLVYKSGQSLGRTATNTISSAISRISDAVNTDIDTQPTIRPVLDLSDVTAGAGVLSGMFDTTANVGISSNIRSISSMMNNRQNVNNDEVISAIKNLGASLGNKSGDVYNINGVSYDGENGVADAIKTIARAALVERRI